MTMLGLSLSLTSPQIAGIFSASPYAAYDLALDFDNADYWASGTRYAALSSMPGYAFTRTGEQGAVDSDGTVDWFAANAPAINGNGYHAYGALTNAVLQSQAFDSATWVKADTAVTSNAATARDGTATADQITESATNTSHRAYQLNVPTTASAVHTASVFVKRGSGTRNLRLQLGDAGNGAYAGFDLGAGTVSVAPTTFGTGWTVQSASIASMGDGWYRVALVFTPTSAAPTIALQMLNGTGTFYLGDGSSSIYAWQAQVVAGNFADGGPLIRTTTAAASIGASNLAVSLANGTYSATYTFDNDTTQNDPALVIADGALNLPADFAPNRNIIKHLLIP